MPEANLCLYRFGVFSLASCTTINSAELPKTLHIGDAFPCILAARASAPIPALPRLLRSPEKILHLLCPSVLSSIK